MAKIQSAHDWEIANGIKAACTLVWHKKISEQPGPKISTPAMVPYWSAVAAMLTDKQLSHALDPANDYAKELTDAASYELAERYLLNDS